MATLPFDTHRAVKELQDAGFEEAQAEAVVATVGSALVGNVATRHDVIEARNESKPKPRWDVHMAGGGAGSLAVALQPLIAGWCGSGA